MKSLVIAEKPSVARDIARVLKCGKNINGAIEGERYVVTWGLGHLVTLADPEDYDKKYKEWKMEDLPIMPEVFKLEVIKQTSKQYQAVKNQIYRGDVGDIIIATDAGREGELVARLILKKTGCNKPIRRLWISSVTDKAIREGFANLKDGREYNNLYDAAMCRAEADWLVGINATRALTCKYNAQLSCGRVQTPTLAMIAKREAQIRAFVPQPYFGLQARKDGLVLTWQDAKTGGRRSFERGRMEALAKDLKGEPAVVAEVKRTPKKTLPPLLTKPAALDEIGNKLDEIAWSKLIGCVIGDPGAFDANYDAMISEFEASAQGGVVSCLRSPHTGRISFSKTLRLLADAFCITIGNHVGDTGAHTRKESNPQAGYKCKDNGLDILQDIPYADSQPLHVHHVGFRHHCLAPGGVTDDLAHCKHS